MFFIIFLAILSYLVYKFVIKGYLVRAYYKKLGIQTTPYYIPLIGDLYYLFKSGTKDNVMSQKVFMPIFLKDVTQPFIYTEYMPMGKILFATQPEVTEEIYQKVGTSLDKDKVNASIIQTFPKSFIFMMTDNVTKKRRTAYQPAFSHSNLKIHTDTFKKCAEEWLQNIGQPKDLEVKMDEKLSDLTLEAIGRAAFGKEFGTREVHLQRNGINTTFKLNQAITLSFEQGIQADVRNPLALFSPIFKKLDFSQFRKDFELNTELIHKGITDIITMREQEWLQEGKPITNLLDMLLQKKDEGILTLEDVLSDAILFIFAGHDTSSRTLTVLIFRTHQNPDIIRKIRQEIKDVIMEGNDDIENLGKYLSYDKIQNLSYITMCIKEALRIDPPAGPISYMPKEDVTIAGIKVKKGVCCVPETFLTHNNPLVWHTPREFIPERFDPESKYYKTPSGEKRHPLSLIPFSAGPRNCIGQNFAMLEMKYLIVYLFANINFEVMYDKMEEDPTFAIGSSKPLLVKITKTNCLKK